MSSKKNKKPPVATPVAQSKPVDVVVSDPHSQERLLDIKEEMLRWIFSVFSALFVYVCAAWLIQKVYNPDVSSLLASAARLLIEPGAARPEPMEAMLFRVGVVVMSLGMLGFYLLFARMAQLRSLAQKPAFLVISTLCVAIIIALFYIDFSAANPYMKGGPDFPQNSRDFTAKTNFGFYFDGLFLGNYLLLYTFILVPGVACLFLLGMKKYDWENKRFYKTGTPVIGYIVTGAVVFAIIAMSVFYFPYSYETKYNFDAVYYSMTQAYSGSAMLVDGFTNTYGLYPQFLNLIFHVIGLSVFKFTLVMALLTGLAFFFNFYALKQFVHNKVILFFGILTVIFFPYLTFKLGQNFDCNFAQYPIRYIIPSTLIFLASLYLKNRSKLIYWLTFGLLAFFTLWNPEIGLVSYLSWLVFNTYNDFYGTDGKFNFRKIAMHWAVGVGCIAVAFFMYKLLIAAFYGASPDLSLLFGTVLVFGKVGFGLLPMTLVHPWNLMAIVLIFGFLYPISRWQKKEITPRSSMILLTAVISVGFLVYFQGRSHNWQLSQSSGVSLILLTLLGDELWKTVKSNNILSLNMLFVVFLFAISFSFFEVLYDRDKITELVYQEDDKSKQAEEQARIESNAEFIQKNTHEHQKIYVFTARQYEGLYFDGSKRQAAFMPGLMDLFLNSDLSRLEKRIVDSSYDVFIEPAVCNFPFLMRPFAEVAATYETKSVNQTMALLQKRKNMVPVQSFFAPAGPAVFYKKYTDDTAGAASRTNDAMGVQPVALAGEFSIQALFSSKDQIFPYATIVGNMNDSSGFILARIINTPNFFFGINGKGVGFPLLANQWVYCVINVFPDHFEVFQNGNLINTYPLAAPMHASPEKLFVGNEGFMRYYVGAISEIAIVNKTMDKSLVQATWESIRQATGSK